MKPFLIAIGLLLSLDAYCQKFTVGLAKTGSTVKNLEGLIVVTDSTVTSTLGDQTATFKITKRDGFTIHVTDGTNTGKYVIGHHSGRLHGFTYDRSVTYHPVKHHAKTPTTTFLCAIKRD